MAGVKKVELMLIDEKADGLRQARIHPSTITSYIVPRKDISAAGKLAGIERNGVYFLLDKKKEHIYIGQTTNGIHRIEEHNRTKDFWDIAVLFLADSKTFNLDTISGFEKYLIEKAKEVKLYQVQNSVVPKFKIDPFDLPAIQDFYAEISLIMSVLGYPIEASEEEKPAETVFKCVRKTAKATMTLRNGKYVVLKDSKLNPIESSSMPASLSALRRTLISDGKLSKDSADLLSDIAFDSPSSAAAFVYGASANGWTEWVDEKGITIDKLIRKK